MARTIRLLNDALPSIRRSEPARTAIALEALADDYNKSFRYEDAARTYDDLLAHFTPQLDPQRLQATKDDSGVMHLLRGVPAQTITRQATVRLKTERDVIGSLVAELEVNGVRGPSTSPITRQFFLESERGLECFHPGEISVR